MNTVLILHGITGRAGIHWQQWLHDQLVSNGYKVIMETFPEPNHPDRQTCLKFVKNLVKDINLDELIIVGHSLGVVTALDFIEVASGKVKALVSVAGFFEDLGAELNSYFMREKQIDMSKVKSNIENSYIIYGDDDPYVPQKKLKDLAGSLGVKPTIIEKGGHLNTEAGFVEFPVLLKIINQL